jgi:hypothetical protein
MKIRGYWRFKNFILKSHNLIKFIQDQHLLKIIDLNKTYSSTFNESYSLEDIIESKNCNFRSKLLKDSIYVQFLNEFKDKSNIKDDEIKKNIYWRAIWHGIQIHGPFNGRKDETSLTLYCHNFLDLYRTIKTRIRNASKLDFIRCAVNYSKDSYPLVFKILNSEYHMLYDGHHRASCYYVLGQRFIKVKILGTRKHDFQAIPYEDDTLNEYRQKDTKQ